jgi:hypothetical protein
VPSAGRDELLGSGSVSIPDWWGAGGRAGWLADGDFGTAPPWTLAGLVIGAWSIEAPARPLRALPWPGVLGAQEPLSWSDSIGIAAGEGGAWRGFDASLATAYGGQPLVREPGDDGRSRSDVTLTRGDNQMNDNAIGFSRGDTLRGLRIEAASGRRGPAGSVVAAARDLYALAAATTRGAHRIEGSFSHRRSSAQLGGGESEGVRGDAGGATYRYRAPKWEAAARWLRGYGKHDSGGGPWSDQRRLSDATTYGLSFQRTETRQRWGLELSWREQGVSPDASAEARARSTELWGAGRWRGPLADGNLELGLGAGRHNAFAHPTVVPSLAWQYHAAPWDARVTAERLATPVWTDLAPGERPFLQDSRVGGLEVGATVADGGRARLGFLAGHTDHRATLVRLPLEAVALREGYRADAGGYDFGLLGGGFTWRTAHWAMSADGFALARDGSALQPRVDPDVGGRAAIQARYHAFQGDLGIQPRIEGWIVGPRESEASPSRRLPADGSLHALLALSIADAVIVFEGRDLLDRRITQTWIDGATGLEARGPGREFRFTFHWRLFD